MKYLKKILVIFITFSAISLNAQTAAEVEAAAKRKLQGDINEIFHRWDNSWSYDTYRDQTAIISSIKESSYSDRQLEVTGTFEVNRSYWITSTVVSVRFTAEVSISNNDLRVTKLCYSDPGSARAKACTNN